jgi:hypothetical protein
MIFVILAALVLLISIVIFIQKVVLKGRLERGLGRKVEDHELTSINAWMDTSAQTNPAQDESPPAPSTSNEQVTRKQKSPGKLALILGLLSIAVVLLSVVLSRAARDDFFILIGFVFGIVSVLLGLLLALMASKIIKKDPGLYIDTGLPKKALGLNLFGGVLVIVLIVAYFSLPMTYYLWLLRGEPFAPRTAYPQQVGDYSLSGEPSFYVAIYGCNVFRGSYGKGSSVVRLVFSDCESADAARQRMEQTKELKAKVVQNAPERAVVIFPKSRSGGYETHVYLLAGNHLTQIETSDAETSLDFEGKLTGKPVIALSPNDYPSDASPANKQALSNPPAPESPPSETILSMRKSYAPMLDTHLAQKGMKSESTLSGEYMSTITVKVNPVRNEAEAKRIFDYLIPHAGETLKTLGVRKIQITSAKGSWGFDV